MNGLMIAALFAAAMSVISSSLNVVAAVLTVDVHQRLIHPAATQRELIFVGRALTAVVGVLAIVIALIVIHFHWSMFDTMVLVFGFFIPPTVLPVVAGLLSRRLSAGGALAGFFAGISVGFISLLYRGICSPSNGGRVQSASLLLSTLVVAFVLLVAAWFFPVRGEAADRSTQFLEKLGRAAPSTETMENPGPIAGLVIGVMGLVLAVLGMGALGRHNFLTIGTGVVLLAIGLLMRVKAWRS